MGDRWEIAKASKEKQIIKQKLGQFTDAIRAKQDWVFKVLGAGRLVDKWTQEFLDAEPTFESKGREQLSAAIRELEDEARRIRLLDYSIHLGNEQKQQTVDFRQIDEDVLKALKYIRCAGDAVIYAPKLKEEVGVFISDGIVPVSLHRELVNQLDCLAKTEPKDFHPGSNRKVQDLIHPSLYPYEIGVTPTINDSTPTPNPTPSSDSSSDSSPKAFQTSAYLLPQSEVDWEIPFDSKYAWIPSIFHISDDGLDVHIESYINGLGTREEYPDLYRVIEKVFLLVLPHFERTLVFDYVPEESDATKRWRKRMEARQGCTREQWNAVLASQRQEKMEQEAAKQIEEEEKYMERECIRSHPFQFYSQDDPMAGSVYRGRGLKVIVKAANYILLPGQDHEGTWHVEGMPHERITDSVIYYYETDDSITDKGLALRRWRAPEIDFPTQTMTSDQFSYTIDPINDDPTTVYEIETDYPSDWEDVYDSSGNKITPSNLNVTIDLGVVPTTGSSVGGGYGTGRILAFPNWIQHKVVGISNGLILDPNMPMPVSGATRKILCFFLIDDDNLEDDYVSYHGVSYSGLEGVSVLTTSEIPIQGRQCNIATLRFLLPIAVDRAIGKNLPVELVESIIGLVDLGVTREVAERRRREVMMDRSLDGTAFGKHMDALEFSLCEH